MDIVATYYPALMYGAGVTIALSLVIIVLGTIVGVLLALAAAKIGFARLFVRGTVHVVMAVPVLVLLVWFFYALPLLDQRFAFSASYTAATALTLSLAAFVADIVYNGLRTLPRPQIDVATVLMGSKFQATRHVLLPHALRTMGVPVLGQYVTTLKFTTLASIVGVGELLHVANDIIQRTYRPVEVYTIVAAIFVALIVPANLALRIIERRLFPERRS